MISKKSIRIRLRQRHANHPNTYAHEHFAAISAETGQSEEIVRQCMLEEVVMVEYALHCQRTTPNTTAMPMTSSQQHEEAFISALVQRMGTFGVTYEIARMALEQHASAPEIILPIQ